VPDTPQNQKTDTLARVVAAMTELGQATAAAIAEQSGLAYPTVTPRLRALEADGRAQRSRADGRTLWRLSAAGTTPTGTTPTSTPQASTAAAGAAATTSAGTAKADTAKTGKAKTGKATAGSRPAKAAARPGAGRKTGGSGQTAQAGRNRRAAAPRPSGPAVPDPAEQPVPGPAGGSADRPTTTGRGRTRGAGTSATPRREKGALRAAVLAIMQSHPDRAYKVGELAKLAEASAGAVANALHKLVHDGSARQTVEHPATYQAD
jgi:hypothetical protein